MRELGRFIVIIGVIATLVGLVMWSGFAPKWLGRLPGDIRIEREHSSFYFPIVTCIVLSIVLVCFFRSSQFSGAESDARTRAHSQSSAKCIASLFYFARNALECGALFAPLLEFHMTRGNRQELVNLHVKRLLRCRRCPRMQSTPVSGGAIVSDVMIIGQAPGPREPTLKRPFAHTAGKTLFRWFEQFCGMDEAAVRSKIYFAAVCRCFPGKNSGGTDRVPAPDEIRNCAIVDG